MASTSTIILLSVGMFAGCGIYALSLSRPSNSGTDKNGWPTMSVKTEVKYEPWPYYLKPCLSNPEQVVFHRLVTAMPDQIILSQVGLSRLLGVKKSHKFSEWHNKINRMSVDFVICDMAAGVQHVIELDDSTHKRADRIVADTKKDKALLDAGMKVIRWNVKNIPSVDEIREQLQCSTVRADPVASNSC